MAVFGHIPDGWASIVDSPTDIRADEASIEIIPASARRLITLSVSPVAESFQPEHSPAGIARAVGHAPAT